MAIRITREPDVQITEGELARYRAEWLQFMSYYAGPPITLEEYIRSAQKRRGTIPDASNPVDMARGL